MPNFDIETQTYKNRQFRAICGIDEAGRGPWAGPVVAAAVILAPDNIPFGLDDSKKLSQSKRENLSQTIKNNAIAFSIAFVDAKIIDEINILQATFLAMKNCVSGLRIQPDYLLIDGNRDPKISIETKLIIKGDSISSSIAAASILAKTARDEFMQNAHLKYPEYGFDKNAGYGVPQHIKALNQFGPCPLHRMSFKPLKELQPQ